MYTYTWIVIDCIECHADCLFHTILPMIIKLTHVFGLVPWTVARAQIRSNLGHMSVIGTIVQSHVARVFTPVDTQSVVVEVPI